MYSWNLDSVGNWTQATSTDTSDVATTENRTHNRLHQLVEADGDYYYDANGNMIDTPSKWLTFDALNRLTAVSHKYAGNDVEFRYDAQGRRIRKTITSEATTKTDYIYSGLRCLEERQDNAMTRQYVWGHYVDELLQIKSADGNRFYPLQDLLYRTNMLTDNDGNIVEKYDTDAYGNTLLFNSADEEIDTPTCEFIFTGRRLDVESGLYYYRARYYNPSLGRFISKDPIGYRSGMNLYRYVISRPIEFLDPYGFSELDQDDYEKVVIDSIRAKITDFNEVFHRMISAYFAADKDNDTFWDCQDDMEEIWEAITDIVDGSRNEKYPDIDQTLLNHAFMWKDTFGDDGSVISHFFSAASFAGAGNLMQDLHENGIIGGTFSPEYEPGDSNRDTAAAYLGVKIADIFDTWGECKCRCIAKKFLDRSIKFTDLFGSDPKKASIQMKKLKNSKEIRNWVNKRVKWFETKIKDC